MIESDRAFKILGVDVVGLNSRKSSGLLELWFYRRIVTLDPVVSLPACLSFEKLVWTQGRLALVFCLNERECPMDDPPMKLKASSPSLSQASTSMTGASRLGDPTKTFLNCL